LAGSVDANDQKDFWMRRERRMGEDCWKNTTNLFRATSLMSFAVIPADPVAFLKLLHYPQVMGTPMSERISASSSS